jgi:hypothetical protein
MSSPKVSYRGEAIKKAEKGKFLSLGYGLIAYFDTLSSFIKLFALFSLISFSVLLLLRLLFDSDKTYHTITERNSLGILG